MRTIAFEVNIKLQEQDCYLHLLDLVMYGSTLERLSRLAVSNYVR
jgi:hypothetical protein